MQTHFALEVNSSSKNSGACIGKNYMVPNLSTFFFGGFFFFFPLFPFFFGLINFQ
jgi:hypothetical protein